MYKGLYDKFSNWFRGGNIWLYSDPHFGDEEMKYIRKNYIGDEEQVRRINSKVGKNDTIIFLGDIGDVEWIKKVRGYKVLIMGNHDSGATNYKKKVEYLPSICPKCKGEVVFDLETARNCGMEYAWCKNCGTVRPIDREENNHLFDEVYEGPVFINDKVVLSHEPFPMARLTSRDEKGYSKDVYCFYNIHGHDHSNTLQKFPDDPFMNVCAEHIDYTPVSLLSMLKKGTFSKIDNIHRFTIDRATAKKGGKKNG